MKSVLKANVERMTADQLVDALYCDVLTDVWNRRAFCELLEPKLRGPRLVVAIIDLDSLKFINDEIGHRAGDEALKEVAFVLSEKFPGRVFRLAGDEFLVYAKDAETLKDELGLHDDDERIYSFGTGRTLEEADDNLKRDKAFREKIGRRAERGEQPPWDYKRFE